MYLTQEQGYDIFTASKIYSRAYKRMGRIISKEFNRDFEAYASIAFENNFVKFDINHDRLYLRKTGEELNGDIFAKAYTVNRLGAFASKYLEINSYLEQYMTGDISLQELNNLIDSFKKTNAEYLKEGS